jgi:hypothetical protein
VITNSGPRVHRRPSTAYENQTLGCRTGTHIDAFHVDVTYITTATSNNLEEIQYDVLCKNVEISIFNVTIV